jgi:energy-coupling factor transport system substrate-specific component
MTVGVAVNLGMGQITALLKIPLYLDSLGTVVVAVLGGIFPAIITGILSNLLASAVFSPAMMFFIPAMFVIAIITGYFAKLKFFTVWWKVIIVGIIVGIAAAIVSAPISANVFGGITLAGTDFIVLYFRTKGYSLQQSVLIQGFIADPIDKVTTFLIAFAVFRNMPRRLLLRFPGYKNLRKISDE